jgi:hypothetical protein
MRRPEVDSNTMIAQTAPDTGNGTIDILLLSLLLWTLFTVSTARRLKRIQKDNTTTPGQHHAARQPRWIPQQVHIGAHIDRVTVNGTNILVILDRPKAPVGIVLERVAVWGDIVGKGGTLASLVPMGGTSARCSISRNGTFHACAGESIRWATDTELETGSN